MAHAIRVHEYGGPESMKWEEVEVGAPGQGQIKVKHHAVGVNYIDTYQRTGLYKQPSMPFTLGMEGAGEVTAVGAGVNDLKVGDRIAYAQPVGSYSTERVMPADRAVKIPEGIDYKTAAAMMLQGMTVRYLIRKTYKVGPDTTLLWHAAAGGVGLIACQWAKHLGATIIATAGSDEKCKLAKAAGATHTINYKTDFSEFRAAFANWTFTNADFEKIPIADEDFIYADPPYDVEFTQYSKGGFGWADQVRAAEWLSHHKGPVILSNQATPRIVKLYRSLTFSLKFVNAPRRISCTGDRTPAPEVLALRNLKS